MNLLPLQVHRLPSPPPPLLLLLLLLLSGGEVLHGTQGGGVGGPGTIVNILWEIGISPKFLFFQGDNHIYTSVYTTAAAAPTVASGIRYT